MSDANTDRPNGRIAGAGDLAGGTYGDLTIAGAGNVRGDIDAITFKVAGAGDVEGSVTASSLSISGTGTINGNIRAGQMSVSGSADVRGNVTADIFKVTGSATVTGRVDAQRFEIKGRAKIGGDVQAEVFESQGVFSVGGLLNAGNVSIRLYGGCSAHDIGGERIEVSVGKTWPWVPFFGEMNLVADTIEADVIVLENTRANVVRGGDVRIGEGCEIDLVEYTGTFTGSAGVRASRKIEPTA